MALYTLRPQEEWIAAADVSLNSSRCQDLEEPFFFQRRKQRQEKKKDTLAEQKLHFVPSHWLHWANAREELRTSFPVTEQTQAGDVHQKTSSWSTITLVSAEHLHSKTPSARTQPNLPCPGLLSSACMGTLPGINTDFSSSWTLQWRKAFTEMKYCGSPARQRQIFKGTSAEGQCLKSGPWLRATGHLFPSAVGLFHVSLTVQIRLQCHPLCMARAAGSLA